jgi:hypothetical protein
MKKKKPSTLLVGKWKLKPPTRITKIKKETMEASVMVHTCNPRSWFAAGLRKILIT